MISNKKRVLVIVKNIDGGTGKFLIEFNKNKNVITKVLVLEKPKYRKANSPDYVFLRKSSFYPQRYSFSIPNFTYLLTELFWIYKNIKLFKPDIIMGMDLRCNLLAISAKIFLRDKIKIIASTHIDLASLTLSHANWFVKMILKLFIKQFYLKSDSLVCVSKGLSRSLKNKFDINKKIEVIYNGITVKQIINPKKMTNKDAIIATTTRLVGQKDNENLLKAFNLLTRDFPNAKLWIMGDGIMSKKLKRLTKVLNLNNSVSFKGWVKPEPYLKKADLFVLSSKSEGFSYSIVEAMSLGLPVISTNAPHGPSEILDKGKYGFLTPISDPLSLKKAMEGILTDKRKYNYFSLKSIERAKIFSTERMLSSYTRLINSL